MGVGGAGGHGGVGRGWVLYSSDSGSLLSVIRGWQVVEY